MAGATPEKIEKFWSWWAEAEGRLVEALEDPPGRRTAIDEIHFRLGKLGLEGDVIPRAGGTDLIVGSAGGDPQARVVAQHWLTLAPTSERFAFATHRPAQPVDHLMRVVLPREPAVRIADMRFAARWRLEDDLVDVTAFVGEGVPILGAEKLARATLTAALGELETEAWVDGIVVVEQPLPGGVDLAAFLAELSAEVDRRKEPTWFMYGYAKPDGGTLTVTVRRPVQPARHPFLDACVTVRNELQTEDPQEGEQFQAQLLDGMPGDVLAVGSVTDQGWRTTFIYANRRSPTIPLLRERAEMLGGQFGSGWDPGWAQVMRVLHVDPKSGLRLRTTTDPRMARSG